VDYGDSGGGFDEEMVPDDEAAPPTPPPPAPAVGVVATPPAAPAALRTPNSLQSILETLQPAPLQPRFESPPRTETEPVVQQATREAQQPMPQPASPQPTPMGRLPSARASKQVAKKRAQVGESLMRPPAPDPDQSYEVELVTGGSSLDGLTYRILWKGWGTLTDWWESLDATGSFDDPEYQGRLMQVLPRGTGPEVSAGKAPPKGKSLLLVLGKHLVDGNKREAFTADGTHHELDLASCVLDDQRPVDWLLQLDDERLHLTDAVLGDEWVTDSALVKTKSAWDGSEYPSIDDAMAVVRVASSSIQAHGSDSVKAAMIEVHLFVVSPTQQQRETAKAHAGTVRKGFLFGGLLHDCLSVIMTVEKDCVQQMIYFAKEFARLHPDDAAWDAAVVAGAI